MDGEGSVLFREVHKNGWLRRADTSDRDKDSNLFWVVFCINDSAEPRLEGYTDQQQAAVTTPLWVHSLRNTLHVSPTLRPTQRHFDFELCIAFEDARVLRLAAPTYQGMCDWVQAIARKLTEMRILGPKENVYSKGPERLATRDPTSPLPLPPEPVSSTASALGGLRVAPSTPIAVPRSETEPAVFTFDDIPGTESGSSYERVFLASSQSLPQQDGRDGGQQSDGSGHYAALMEYSSSPSTQPAARAHSRSPVHPRQLTLREQQVLQLRREMSHPAGVRLRLRRRDCKDNIAFVDVFGAVWVAGWKQREHPMLYNVLHIGDLVLSLAGITPQSASAVRDILKSCAAPYVEVVVRRLPHGRATTLTRHAENEGFGLELNGSEVTGVTRLAVASGLPALAPSTDPSSAPGTFVTWTITEVNGRPLNLFAGGEGVRERLGAVGRDVSVVVQPTDLVSCLRKRLHTLRGYKNYAVQ